MQTQIFVQTLFLYLLVAVKNSIDGNLICRIHKNICLYRLVWISKVNYNLIKLPYKLTPILLHLKLHTLVLPYLHFLSLHGILKVVCMTSFTLHTFSVHWKPHSEVEMLFEYYCYYYS